MNLVGESKQEVLEYFNSAMENLLRDRDVNVRNVAKNIEFELEKFKLNFSKENGVRLSKTCTNLSHDVLVLKSKTNKLKTQLGSGNFKISVLDVLEDPSKSIHEKKTFLKKFKSDKAIIQTDLHTLKRMIAIAEKNKNFEVKKFLMQELARFPIRNIFSELLLYLGSANISHNLTLSKFLQRVYKEKMDYFVELYLEQRTKEILKMLLKRFKKKSTRLFIARNKMMFDELVELLMISIKEEKDQIFRKMNLDLICKIYTIETLQKELTQKLSQKNLKNEIFLINKKSYVILFGEILDPVKDNKNFHDTTSTCKSIEIDKTKKEEPLVIIRKKSIEIENFLDEDKDEYSVLLSNLKK